MFRRLARWRFTGQLKTQRIPPQFIRVARQQVDGKRPQAQEVHEQLWSLLPDVVALTYWTSSG